jgi:hypothetical protein
VVMESPAPWQMIGKSYRDWGGELHVSHFAAENSALRRYLCFLYRTESLGVWPPAIEHAESWEVWLLAIEHDAYTALSQ